MCRLVLLATLAAVLLAAGPEGGVASSLATSCAAVSKPKPRDPGRLKAPTTRLEPSKRWTMTFGTSCGTFVVLLQPRTSPHAAASLVALARRHYFDSTIIHRVVPGFVIQGGDPTQSGAGGPGYTTVDTPRAGTRYVKGIVAMAKTSIEPRGAAGSQFFVMIADAPLPPDYAVVGRIVSGLAVVQRIGTFGDRADPNGTPTRVVVVRRVTISAT